MEIRQGLLVGRQREVQTQLSKQTPRAVRPEAVGFIGIDKTYPE